MNNYTFTQNLRHCSTDGNGYYIEIPSPPG
jgi:hypothetical protein